MQTNTLDSIQRQRQVPPCAARRGLRGIINQARPRADKVGGNTNYSARIDRGGTPPRELDREGEMGYNGGVKGCEEKKDRNGA